MNDGMKLALRMKTLADVLVDVVVREMKTAIDRETDLKVDLHGFYPWVRKPHLIVD